MAIHINSAWDAECFYREREEARKRIQSAWDAQKFYETYGGNGHQGNWGFRYNAYVVKPTGTYTYNPISREWTLNTFSGTNLSTSPISTGNSGTISQSSASKDGGATTSKKDAEKEYIDIEFNTLTGDISLIPTTNNLKLKAGCTVEIEGVGKYLSGIYFVSEVKKSITRDNGFSISATLYKNGFGKTLKSSSATDTESSTNKVSIQANIVNSKYKVGDKVKVVGENAVYYNPDNEIKIPDWVKQKLLIVKEVNADGTRVLVDLVWQWIPTQYLQLQ